MSVEIGQNFSHYQILEKLGEGGMGVVYKAFDSSLKRNVALKFLPANLTENISSRKRFIVEAQAASALDHPNICNIHEINETDDGQLYICMAYYDGESLRQKIKKGPLTFEESLDIFFHIAQGLKAAHEEKIVHRDIKPGNIIITDKGEVKIVDFGLAKLNGVSKLTKETSTLGTIHYMSPEQLQGKEVDHRSDIWSLGVVIYELLTGEPPFKGDYESAVHYAILNEEAGLVDNSVSQEIKNVLDKCLSKKPEDRYEDVGELADELKSTSEKPSDKDFGKIGLKKRWANISILVSVLVLVFMAIGIAIGIMIGLIL